jgi:ferredoxin-NADP reductase/MOSC domain-containing protein YiiM/ferredoxin
MENPMRVLSVNAGPLKPMNVQGDGVQTGFFKSAVKGPVRVHSMGLEDDSRVACASDPHRAVFFYQADSYDWWRSELQKGVGWGMFGENITFEGPQDDFFYIGDVLRVGSAVVQITQPRHPCVKIGVKMGDPKFPIAYLKAGRLGFHTKVLEEGFVEEGDRIELIDRVRDDPYPMKEFTRVIFLEPGDVKGIERMIAAPALVPEWKMRAERLWRKQAGKNGWQDYRSLRVTKRKQESVDVVSLDIEDPDGLELPAFDAGQFVTLRLDVSDRGDDPLTRTYTISGRSQSGSGYSITVKRDPSGAGSAWLCEKIREGHLLKALPPRGAFVVEPGSRPVVLISAGIGVTPMVAMLDQLASDPLDREVYFIHGSRSGDHHVLDARVRKVIAANEKLHRFVKYSRPNDLDVIGLDYDAKGRISIEDIQRILPSLDADYYLCGPVPLLKDLVPALAERGVEKERLRYEFFGLGTPLFDARIDNLGEPELDAGGKPIMVTFAKSGLTVPWTGNKPSLLILAEHSGLQPAQSCRNGLCEVCICRLDSGKVQHEGEIINLPKEGDVMICCARPLTSVMIDI